MALHGLKVGKLLGEGSHQGGGLLNKLSVCVPDGFRAGAKGRQPCQALLQEAGQELSRSSKDCTSD